MEKSNRREQMNSSSGGSSSNAALFAPAGDCRDDKTMKIFWILYVIGALGFTILGFMDLVYFVSAGKVDWLITTSKFSTEYYFTPNKIILDIVFFILICFGAAVCVIMFLKGTKITNSRVYDMAFSSIGRLISIAMIITCGAMLIPIIQQRYWNNGHRKNADEVACKSFSMVFMLLSVPIYVFAFVKMESASDSDYPAVIFKKGFLSASIAYFIFLFWNALSDLIRDDNTRRHAGIITIHSDLARVSVAFIIIYAIIMLILSFLFKDVIMAFFAMMLNMGFMINSARTNPNSLRRITGNLVCGIIFFILFLLVMVFLVIKYKNECFS